jgi:hypothetical protein
VNLLIPGPVELVEGRDLTEDLDMPRVDELLVSVRDFLREDIMSQTSGRTQFLARVAGNSLDVVLRDLSLGGPHRHLEQERLQALLGNQDTLGELRWRLVNALRDGSMALDHPGLAEHLRRTTVNQLAIDQPRYPALNIALAKGGSK